MSEIGNKKDVPNSILEKTSSTSSLNSKHGTEYKSGVDLPKTESLSVDNKTTFTESSQESPKSSKGVTFLKSVTINLSANKHKGGFNDDRDAEDETEESKGESVPLIPRPNHTWSFCDKFWLVIFVIMVTLGVIVGAFLLIWLGYLNTHYHLVVKNQWTTIYPTEVMAKLKLPIHNVSFIELNASDTSVCGDYMYAACVKFIQEQHITQLNESDILYNFIVDQDGTIYEGRGWENCTCNGQFTDEDLTIGILVNDGLLKKRVPMFVKNFLNKAEDKLDPCFTVASHNGTTLNPVVARVEDIIRKDKC